VRLQARGAFDVRPLTGAVFVDVGEEDGADVPPINFFGELDDVLLALLLPTLDRELPVARIERHDDPTLDRELPVARIERHDDPFGVSVTDRPRDLGRLDGHGAEHDPRGAGIHPLCGDGFVSHATTNLHLKVGLPKDALNDRDVHRRTAARALEIDHMKPLGSFILEPLGHGHRIIVVHGDLVVFALMQADDLAIEQINRRNQLHETSPRKCAMTRAPAC